MILRYFLPFLTYSLFAKNFSQVAWGGVTETSDCPSQATGVLVGACPEVRQVLGHCWGQDDGELVSHLSLQRLVG